MKRLYIIIIGVIAVLTTAAENRDSLFVATALSEARNLPRTTNFPLHFARLFM